MPRASAPSPIDLRSPCLILVFPLGRHGPGRIGVIAAPPGVPEDAVQRVLVGLVDFIQRQFAAKPQPSDAAQDR